MKDLLSAKHVLIFSDTGTRKLTVVRVLLIGPVTSEYPVTYIQVHTNYLLMVDQLAAASPLAIE